nr:MAG TPA: hypothetical protein [Caudoviricetes sp.]
MITNSVPFYFIFDRSSTRAQTRTSTTSKKSGMNY